MPSAPPSSELVSEIAAAAPARSGGAEPTIRSVPSVITGARPREKIVVPTTMPVRPLSATRDSATRPSAATISPVPISQGGRTRRPSAGATMDPTMNPADQGNVHSPAASGDSPRTSWRYCPMKT